MAKAGLVSALALTLLVPTFNALNLSYVENVQPPPWIPTPEKPPNITPPTNFEPPPDFEPPEGWEGEMPPGACPPPVLRVIPGTETAFSIGGPAPSWTQVVPFELPEGVLAFGGWVNFTGWQGTRVDASLEGPQGYEGWAEGEGADAFLLQPTPKTSRFEYNSTDPEDQSPTPAGDYGLTLRVANPIAGRVTTKLVMALACGGMMSG